MGQYFCVFMPELEQRPLFSLFFSHCSYWLRCDRHSVWTKIKLRFIDEYVPNRITFRDKRFVQEKLVAIVESQHLKGNLNLR